MGNTGAALYRGGMSNIYNPAFLIGEESHRLDMGLSLDQQHEDRFVPIFDGFQSFVADVSGFYDESMITKLAGATACRVELRPI